MANNYRTLSRNLNRNNENYTNLSQFVRDERTRLMAPPPAGRGLRQPQYIGMVPTLRNAHPELMENVFPREIWSNNFIAKEMRLMIDPNNQALTPREDRRRVRHQEEQAERRQLHADLVRNQNETARLRRQNSLQQQEINDLNQRILENDNFQQRFQELQDDFNQVSQERDELLQHGGGTSHDSDVVQDLTTRCVNIEKSLMRNNFAIISSLVVLSTYSMGSQFCNGVRFVLEKTLETLP